VYIYIAKFKPIYLIDILGILFLTGSSYLFHTTLKNDIFINRLDDKMIYIYLNDIIAINIRPFFCMIVMCPKFAPISFLLHFGCSYLYIHYLLDCKRRNIHYSFFSNINSNIQKVFHLPILIDSIIPIFYNCSPITIIIPSLLILVSIIKPFYHMNHLVLHILFFCQTYYLCQINIVLYK